MRPRTASVDDGRDTCGCGVGRTRVTFVLRHRGRSRTVLRVLRASFVLTPPRLLRVRILPAWGRSSARSLTRVLGLKCGVRRLPPKDFHRGRPRTTRPRRPARRSTPPAPAGPRGSPEWRTKAHCRLRAGQPFVALGLLRGEILAGPRSPPVAWVTARTGGTRAPAGRGWPEAECPSPARFRWRRGTV